MYFSPVVITMFLLQHEMSVLLLIFEYPYFFKKIQKGIAFTTFKNSQQNRHFLL